MSDIPPDTQPPVIASKGHGSRGTVNQAHLDELTLAEALVRTSQKPEYATLLAAGEITAEFGTTLLTDTAAARKTAANAVGKSTGRQVVTVEEQNAQNKLTALLHGVQARARQKFADQTPERLRDYYIGKGQQLDANRSTLEQATDAILQNLATDVLPGITAQMKTDIAAALKDYKQTQTDQTSEQSGATGARTGLAAAVADIAARRKKIQFAADATWPHENPANAAIRREFKLPASRSLKA